jgi:hypothetical protein
MDGHDWKHEATSDHDHADGFAVHLRRVGWAHYHDQEGSTGARRPDSIDERHAPSCTDHGDFPTDDDN